MIGEEDVERVKDHSKISELDELLDGGTFKIENKQGWFQREWWLSAFGYNEFGILLSVYVQQVEG